MSLTKQRPQQLIGGTDGESNSTEIDREVAYQALSNRRRRFTIHYLMQVGEPVTLRRLSEQVAAWENGVSRSQITSKQRKRVYTALHQAHLPKLDKMDIVEYDTHDTAIYPTENLTTLRVYMEVVPENEIPWSVFYTGIALLFGTGAVLGWASVTPFDALSGTVWGLLTVMTIAVVGVINIYCDQQNRLGVDGPPPEVSYME
ncbi:hypothetical protein D8Y22_07175 [Salinadaptatus halalkaliphilus]|uniref:DUF7344 domain-containing protein n=1 Tax=Salinadaptatus halalkaliphilus TaxID=2419781 RepID=A0A4S3TSI6_9EURY|nr:CopD family protein [Salinadaptatus halalkaliphilus]THE65588.1 hypothetical protein D8Y22_07175 [Salinadaptatus halalkaliphilus]